MLASAPKHKNKQTKKKIRGSPGKVGRKTAQLTPFYNWDGQAVRA